MGNDTEKQTDIRGLISVIIPVYNIEKYIGKCVDSVLSQTYRHIEILLIDDGSSDTSGKICDDYSARDERVRVIHQANKGTAEVRNVGIREAKGEYILFVDGDDWIDSDTAETCINYSRQYDADMVCFRFSREYEDGREMPAEHTPYPPKLMSSSEALSLIFFPQYIDPMICNKLIKSDIFRDIKFPSGKKYEDMYTTYKAVAKAQKILCISRVMYHYLQRMNTNSHDTFSEKTYALDNAAQECFDYITGNTQQTKEGMTALNCGLWFWKIITANYMIRANSPDKEYISSLRREIKPLQVLRCPLFSFTRKVQLLLFKYSQTVYKILYMKLKNL